MNQGGPIIIIEDDADDQELLKKVFFDIDCKNRIVFFEDGEEALKYLTDTTIEPFIVFSDINMPKLSGLELRTRIQENEDLRLKSIPYLIFSTSSEQDAVVDAYSKSVQGFFVKPPTYQKLKNMMKIIIDYWNNCESPNYIK